MVAPGNTVVFSLIDGGEAAGHNGALPAAAFARVQKLNSLGEFNDVYFIGSGRDLSIPVLLPGTYRVVKGETSEGSAFGVDITSADFALAAPGDLGPGVGTTQGSSLKAIASDVAAPFPSTIVTRQMMMDNGWSTDVACGIHLRHIGFPQQFSEDFPPRIPNSGNADIQLMIDGHEFLLTVALQLFSPLPAGSVGT
ncbi:MAG: hypothetical protein ABL934_09700 [Lysobacteraceae bacterium]